MNRSESERGTPWSRNPPTYPQVINRHDTPRRPP